jgi:hypothetical protein
MEKYNVPDIGNLFFFCTDEKGRETIEILLCPICLRNVITDEIGWKRTFQQPPILHGEIFRGDEMPMKTRQTNFETKGKLKIKVFFCSLFFFIGKFSLF